MLFIKNSIFLLALLIIAIVVKLISKQRPYPTLIFYSVTYEQAFLNSNPKELNQFLKESRFDQYLNTEKVLWQVRSWHIRRIRTKGFTYDASFYLFKSCISWKTIFSAIQKLSQLWKIPIKLGDTSFSAFYSHSFERFVWKLVCLELTTRINLTTTQSSYSRLPVSFSNRYASKTSRIMMWYSINSQGISRDFDSPEGIPLHAITGKIDLQLVWSDTQRALLQNKNVGEVVVVGSCLFQIKHPVPLVKGPTTELNVIFFDVLPVRQDLSAKVIKEFNLQNSLYDYNFCARILLESISTLDAFTKSHKISFKIIVKPKRSKLRRHLNYNKSYEDLLLNLEVKDSRFSVIQSNVNLYSLVRSADLVIGPPYTSPIFIARELNVPSCYLAFETKGWRIHKSLDMIPTFFSKQEFLIFLQETFSSKFSALDPL